MVRLKIAYWEFDFEAVCPTLDHDLLSQAHIINALFKQRFEIADTADSTVQQLDAENNKKNTTVSLKISTGSVFRPHDLVLVEIAAVLQGVKHSVNDS